MANPINTIREKSDKILTLHHLISKLDHRFRNVVNDRFSTIVNEVPQKLTAKTNEEKLVAVLNTILNSLVNGTYRDKIYISAREFSNLVLIQIRNNHAIDKETLRHCLQPAQQLAEELGGCIEVNDLTGTTVSVTFLNNCEKPRFGNDNSLKTDLC